MIAARHPLGRSLLVAAGAVLMLAAPVIGVLPGPGGIFVFAAGLALTLRNSRRARTAFVRAKRRWPRLGGWIDRLMRRRSARRRRERDQGR